MLLAGASADNLPGRGGAFTFRMSTSPLWAGWNYGSAEKHIGLY